MDDARRFVWTIACLWGALGAFSLAAAEAPEFRPWERLYRPAAFRFAASQRVAMREIGDLGYKTWNRALQSPRPTVFTTDRWGYRNARDIDSPEVVVIGDSFVAGSGLSDDETVTQRLAAHLGAPVYNFASEELNAPALFLRDERFATRPPKVVIWAPVARGIAARPLFFEGSRTPAAERDRAALAHARRHLARWGATLAAAVDRLNRDNGLVRESRFALQGLLARVRPDPRTRRLPSGETVLALGLDEQQLLATPEERRVDHCIEMVTILARGLERAGVRFLFSPIPEAGSIYPELYAPRERRAMPAVSFLDRLIAGAAEQGVEVVDLREVYRTARAPYLYLPDDSHWNGRATELAARAWARQLGAPDAPTAPTGLAAATTRP
jgi:hypothetical protein